MDFLKETTAFKDESSQTYNDYFTSDIINIAKNSGYDLQKAIKTDYLFGPYCPYVSISRCGGTRMKTSFDAMMQFPDEFISCKCHQFCSNHK